jgi:hypothetical protein
MNLIFNQSSKHGTLNNKASALPLPKNTTFVYHFSEYGATYFTTSSIDKTIDYYKYIADNNSFKELYEDNAHKLLFTYKNLQYSIIIEKSINPKGNYLKVKPIIDKNK